MKRFFALFLWTPLMAVAQDNFVISGSLQGLPEGSDISLSDPNRPGDTLAKTVVKDGAFILNGTVSEPNLYQLNLDGIQKKSILFLGNDKVNITGNAATIQDITVTGSPVHNDFVEFKNIFTPIFQQLNQMGEQLKASPGIKEDDPKVVAYLQEIDKVRDEADKFVAAHKTSPVAPFVVVVTSEMEQDFSRLEHRYALLDTKVKNGFYGRIAREQLDSRAGSVGTEAVDFSQADTEGKQVALSSFRGKYVLVDFWASWCRPCREENPNVVKAFNAYKDKNFTVLGVSLDNSRQPWLKAIKADNLTWTQVSDLMGWNNAVAAKYKIQSIPQNFLVGPSGRIIAKNLRGPELHSKLSELLNK